MGDFFASGPGVNPFSSLPLSVEADGTMTCRFVMPYEKSVAHRDRQLHTPAPVRLDGSVLISPWQWDERSLYFRAKWRADHDLLAGAGALDLPYLVAIGKGVFAGCAAMIMNPSGRADGRRQLVGRRRREVPGGRRSWRRRRSAPARRTTSIIPGAGRTSSTIPIAGSRWTPGPDTAGYVSNHRFQVLDAIPFEKSLARFMELWAHNRTPGLSYARIAYHYARPGAMDDHRGLMPSDLKIPPLPKREPMAAGGASGRDVLLAQTNCNPEATAGTVETVPFPLATQLQVAHWQAAKGRQAQAQPAGREGRPRRDSPGRGSPSGRRHGAGAAGWKPPGGARRRGANSTAIGFCATRPECEPETGEPAGGLARAYDRVRGRWGRWLGLSVDQGRVSVRTELTKTNSRGNRRLICRAGAQKYRNMLPTY